MVGVMRCPLLNVCNVLTVCGGGSQSHVTPKGKRDLTFPVPPPEGAKRAEWERFISESSQLRIFLKGLFH